MTTDTDSDELLKDDRVQLLVRLEPELLKWLKLEKRRSGRSMSWMVANAVSQWRDRIEKGRKTE